jgi:hypothetical protein
MGLIRRRGSAGLPCARTEFWPCPPGRVAGGRLREVFDGRSLAFKLQHQCGDCCGPGVASRHFVEGYHVMGGGLAGRVGEGQGSFCQHFAADLTIFCRSLCYLFFI